MSFSFHRFFDPQINKSSRFSIDTMGRLVEGRRGVKRKATTRTDFSKKICGKPSELDETEPPINSQIIQHGYFLSNSYPDKDENEICTMVHRDVVKVWTAVNPRLKLLEEKVAKQKIHRLLANAYDYNNKHLTVAQRKNLEAKLDNSESYKSTLINKALSHLRPHVHVNFLSGHAMIEM